MHLPSLNIKEIFFILLNVTNWLFFEVIPDVPEFPITNFFVLMLWKTLIRWSNCCSVWCILSLIYNLVIHEIGKLYFQLMKLNVLSVFVFLRAVRISEVIIRIQISPFRKPLFTLILFYYLDWYYMAQFVLFVNTEEGYGTSSLNSVFLSVFYICILLVTLSWILYFPHIPAKVFMNICYPFLLTSPRMFYLWLEMKI